MSRLPALTLVLLYAACAPPQSSALAPDASSLALTCMNVVDVESGRVLADWTVLITGSRIVRIAPSRRTRIPTGAQVVDSLRELPRAWHQAYMTGDAAAVNRILTEDARVIRGISGAVLNRSEAALYAVHRDTAGFRFQTREAQVRLLGTAALATAVFEETERGILQRYRVSDTGASVLIIRRR